MTRLFSRRRLSTALLACLVCAVSQAGQGNQSASSSDDAFQFGVIGHAFKTTADEAGLKQAIVKGNAADLAFIVANGIKASAEPCSDKLYQQRKDLFAASEIALIVSLTASDWTECKNSNGKTTAIERLNRVRELFFADEFSLGNNKIPLARLSTTKTFRNYAENARWELNGILFATINLPLGNNHYRVEAGRNNEFEDRLVANKAWLRRILTIAKQKNLRAIVLFCDANPLAQPTATRAGRHDGFAEMRLAITAAANKFSGKLLLIDAQPLVKTKADAKAREISWHGNLGHLSVASGALAVKVLPSHPELFVAEAAPGAVETRK